MLKRYLLIVALLAGAGVICITQFQVRPRILALIDQRDQNGRERNREKDARLKSQADVKAKEAALAASVTSLQNAQAENAAAQAKLDSAQQLAQGLQQNLAKVKADKLSAEQQLARVEGLPGQVAKLKAANVGLLAKNADLEKQIDELKNPPEFPPAGLRARIVGIDPKWNFVVLDIGQEQKAQPKWNLIVSRGSKLVGKVQITTVLPGRSIANILPGWKLDELLEGDLVLPEIRVSSSVSHGLF